MNVVVSDPNNESTFETLLRTTSNLITTIWRKWAITFAAFLVIEGLFWQRVKLPGLEGNLELWLLLTSKTFASAIALRILFVKSSFLDLGSDFLERYYRIKKTEGLRNLELRSSAVKCANAVARLSALVIVFSAMAEVALLFTAANWFSPGLQNIDFLTQVVCWVPISLIWASIRMASLQRKHSKQS